MRKLPHRTTKVKKKSVTNENSDVKTNLKTTKNVSQTNKVQTRRVLADKTNSGSDINQSPSSLSPIESTVDSRPKRTHQLPARFLDHDLRFHNKSSPKCSSTPLPSKSNITEVPTIKAEPQTSKKKPTNIQSIKTPVKKLTTSPDKNTAKKGIKVDTCRRVTTRSTVKKTITKVTPKTKAVATKETFQNTTRRSNPRHIQFVSPTKSVSPDEKNKNTVEQKKIDPIYKNKLIILDDTQPIVSNKLALYEFKCDPTETPPKAKKKKIVKKRKPTIRKKKILSDSFNDDAMRMLIEDVKKIQAANLLKKLRLKKQQSKNANYLQVPPITNNHATTTEINQNNFDVVFENNPPVECPNAYSPRFDRTHSPAPPSPIEYNNGDEDVHDDQNHDSYPSIIDRDALENNQSVRFSNHPVACSSMIQNLSNKPCESPWRMDLDSDIKKWPFNFYVKPSMTPAYERDTFHILGLDDDNDKSVEQNQNTDSSTETVASVQRDQDKPTRLSNLKQTSILSFYEQSFKKSQRKKGGRSPKKAVQAEHYDDLSLLITPVVDDVEVPQVPEENFKQAENPIIDNCFGFDDDIIDIDQENISPVKTRRRAGGKSKTNGRGILKERNIPNRLTPSQVRNILGITKANKNIEKVTQVLPPDEVAPIVRINPSSSDSDNSLTENATDNTSQDVSTEKEVALFEDPAELELVHYNKPTRKSYERRIKPPVRFKEVEDFIEEECSQSEAESENGEVFDIIIKSIKRKKLKKKPKVNQLSKKEEKEANEWAAGFNSILEEAEDFPLCIE